MTTATEEAANHARKFRELATAQASAANQKYFVPVLHGDDGRYWVATTSREAGVLMAAGYEEV